MKNMKVFLSLKWYYQLSIALVTLLLTFLLVKFLMWLVPIILGILALLLILTEGEIFDTMWESYKQRKQKSANPLFLAVYHWLTEEGVKELPISTLQFPQGVEFPDSKNGLYFIYIEKEVSDELLADFETKLRQTVKSWSNDLTDCVVSRSNREPFLAIKVRLVATDEMALSRNQATEDF